MKRLQLRNNYNLQKDNISNIQSVLSDMEKVIKNAKLKDLDEIAKKEEELKEKNNEVEKRIKKLEDKIKEIEKREKELNDKIIKIKEREEEINIKNEEYKKKDKELNDLKIKYEKEVEKNNIIEKEKIDLEQKNKKLENKIKSIQNQLSGVLTNIDEKIEIKYNSPSLIGLNNIGAASYINSTLQCLSQTKSLTDFFLKQSNKDKIINNNIALKNKNNLQLSPVYLELIQKLWEVDGPKSFSPNKFVDTVNKLNPLFKTEYFGDLKDFIIFVLEQLHYELKYSVNKDNIINENINQYDRNNAFNHFVNELQKKRSIINDIFYGFYETTNECIYCKNHFHSKGLNNNPICYNYLIFNCLIFPLEEVIKMKNNYNQNILNNNNSVSLYECFVYNQRSEYFTGENQNFCNYCRQLNDSIYTSKIFTSPNVLVLILNRGKGYIYNIKLEFNETIDISEFVLKKEIFKLIYNLYGVITLIGKSGPNPHFIASCKSPIDNKWYRYNDAIVTPITNIQKEIIDFGTPCVLFYQKNSI